MKNIDPITQKKIILVRRLYQQAFVQSGQSYNIMNRILSIITFDLAIETAIKTVISTLDASKTPSQGFNGLLQQATSVLKQNELDALPDKAKIQHVHGIRNDCQHKAKYPSKSDLDDCRVYTRDFLKSLFVQVWHIKFDEMSSADAISNDQTRKYCVKAEKKLKEGKLSKAIELTGVALKQVIQKVEGPIVGISSPFVDGIQVTDLWGKPLDGKHVDMYRTFERMKETLLFLALGIDHANHIKLRRLTGHITLLGDEDYRQQNQILNPTVEDAEFSVTYVINTIIQIEQRVEDIENPFGFFSKTD